MTGDELRRLAFRRQYLLVPEHIECPFQHRARKVTDTYTLYTHLDLVIADLEIEEIRLILLGDLFDYEDPQKDNQGILRDLISLDLNTLLTMSSKYSGRFVLIRIEDQNITLLHDATASRKIFYSLDSKTPWFSSQSHLLAKVKGFNNTSDPSKLGYYNSAEFVALYNSNLGNTTYYDEIIQLMPNHYFDVKSQKAIRF